MEDKPYMTMDEAEDIVIAAELGCYAGSGSRLAHALLLYEQREQPRQPPSGGKE